MKIARFAAALLVISQLSLPALAVGEPTKKPFTGAELGLAFLDDPAKLSAEPDKMLNTLFSVNGPIIKKLNPTAQALAKPLTEEINKLKANVLETVKGKSAEMKPFLAPYQVLAKTPVTYEQLPLPTHPTVRQLVSSSNEVLKNLWRITASIQLSEQLLPKLQQDVASIKPGDTLKKASLAVVAVSLANLNMGSFQSVDLITKNVTGLNSRIQKEITRLQAEITKHPEKAAPMAEDIQALTTMTGTLANALTQLGTLSPKLPGITSGLAGVLPKLL